MWLEFFRRHCFARISCTLSPASSCPSFTPYMHHLTLSSRHRALSSPPRLAFSAHLVLITSPCPRYFAWSSLPRLLLTAPPGPHRAALFSSPRLTPSFPEHHTSTTSLRMPDQALNDLPHVSIIVLLVVGSDCGGLRGVRAVATGLCSSGSITRPVSQPVLVVCWPVFRRWSFCSGTSQGVFRRHIFGVLHGLRTVCRLFSPIVEHHLGSISRPTSYLL